MKLKSLRIISERGGFYAGYDIKEYEQHLTIASDGRIWFNAYGLSINDSWEKHRIRASRKSISKESAFKILNAAIEFLPSRIDHNTEIFDCDASPDKYTLRYEDGEIECGQLWNNSEGVQKFYDTIRNELKIDNLLKFDYTF